MTREIQLTHGFVALVDDEDYEWLNAYKWHRHNTGYARRGERMLDGKVRDVLMHRMILGLAYGDPRQCDHANRNRADNRRQNLRVCTRADNSHNHPSWSGCSSRFKGVYWFKEHKHWMARIGFEKKRIFLGYYIAEEEAARAYDKAAIEHHGEFACTNESLGLFAIR